MIKIFNLLLIVTPLLSCGVNYTRVVIVPTEYNDGWIDNRGSHIYYCAQTSGVKAGSSISTMGISSYEYRQKTIFYQDVFEEYADKTPGLQIATSGGMVPGGECARDLISITYNNKEIIPISVTEHTIYGMLNCNYVFNHDVIDYETLTLSFNSQYTDCIIPDLILTKHIDKGRTPIPLY